MADVLLFWGLNVVACCITLSLHALRARLTVGPSIAWAGLSVFFVWGLIETGWWVSQGELRFNGALMSIVPMILGGMVQVYALDGVRIARTYFVVCVLSAVMAMLFLEFRLALSENAPMPILIQSSIESQSALVASLALALLAACYSSEGAKRIGEKVTLVFGTVVGIAVFAVAYSLLVYGLGYGYINFINEYSEYAIASLPALFAQTVYGVYAAKNHFVMPARRFADVVTAWKSAEREVETAKRDALEAQEQIIELQELTRALRDERQRRLHQTENSPLAIIDIGPDRKVKRANYAAISLLRRAARYQGDLIGSDAESIFPGFRLIDHTCVGKAVFDVIGPDISRRIELALLPVGATGHFGGFSAIVEDVTETERARTRERTETRIRDLHRTARAITHDFSNLFTAIEAHTKLIVRTNNSESSKNSTDAIDAAVLRGRAMLAQLGAGQSFSRPELDNVDVDELIQEAFAIHRAAARFGDITLHSKPGANRLVQADAHQIARVLVNLIGNSIRATPPGGSITVSTAAVGPGVEIAVHDTGCGMSEPQVRQAFDPAFSTKGDGVGGLGLAVSYLIVDAHGGRIDIQSEKGRGTIVRVWLPAVDRASEQKNLFQAIVVLPDWPSRNEICEKLVNEGIEVLEPATAKELATIIADMHADACIVVTSRQTDEAMRFQLRQNPNLRLVELDSSGAPMAGTVDATTADPALASVYRALAPSRNAGTRFAAVAS